MKIIQLLPELNAGGVERGVLELNRFLVGKGHESVVISNGGGLVSVLEEDGGRHVVCPVHRKSLGSLRQISMLRRIFEEEKPDVIHLRSRVPAWIAYLAWRKMEASTRPRLVTTVHGFYSVNSYSKIMVRGEVVIAVSESIREYIETQYPGVSKGRIKVIHRGVRMEDYPADYSPSEEWKAQWVRDFPETAGKKLVVLPGRVTRLKGHGSFFKILVRMRDQGVHGVIAGGAHPRKEAYLSELKELVVDTGLEDRVTFAGHRSDLRDVLAHADVVVSLSQKPEAFGRTTLEALALGTPVVGYDRGGVGEILRRCFPVGLAPANELSATAKLIEELLSEAPVPSNIGDFSLAGMLESTEAVYEQLVGADPDR